MTKRSAAYITHRMQGPFPGRIDPWAEIGHYFHQIHGGMITHFITQIQRPLLELGYEAGREASLQILEHREPDIYVRRSELPDNMLDWDYVATAEAISAAPGIAVEWGEPYLDAIYIRDYEANLVTIVEIVSPSNKSERGLIADYRERRNQMIYKGVNIVEVDLTRSVKRLLEDDLTTTYDYHVAVYLPRQIPRIIGYDFGVSLGRIALPLRGEVVPMELQRAYDFAYQETSIAGQIYSDGRYIKRELPFPSLMNEKTRQESLEAVQTWIEQLERLKSESSD